MLESNGGNLMGHWRAMAVSWAKIAAVVSGLVLLTFGLYQSLDRTFGMVPTAALGYIGVALMLELGVFTLIGLRSRMGRIVVMAGSVGFLESAFLWTCGLGLPFTNEFFLGILR